MTSGRRCIFCGSAREITSEHVLARWIEKLFEHEPSHAKFQIFNRYERPDALSHQAVVTEDRITGGNLYTLRVRQVCRSCNNGWMSALESRVMPSLAQLARDEPASHDASAAAALATWAAKTTVVLEYTNDLPRTIPERHRQWVRTNQEPPEYMRVFLSRHDRGITAEVRQSSMALLPAKEFYSERPEGGNVAFTAITIGKMHLTILSTTVETVANLALPNAFRDRMLQLWPSPQPFRWPPCGGSLGDEHIDGLLAGFKATVALKSQGPMPPPLHPQ